MLGFRKVSEEFIDRLVNEGKLYLFKIWNKDFSEYSKGTPNLHTMYWNMLFDERNLADVVYKLNGQAELFYRKKSLDLSKTSIRLIILLPTRIRRVTNGKATLNMI